MIGDDELQAKVDVMAKVFLGRLHVRYEKMNEAYALCRHDAGDAAAWTELHRLLHSLAGAAGSFGCDALGARAKAVEEQVRALQAAPVKTQEDVESVGRALAALQSET